MKKPCSLLFTALAYCLLLSFSKEASAQPPAAPIARAKHITQIQPQTQLPMENQSAQVVKAFLTAVQEGNHQQLGALLHPDVQWHQPGNNRFSGTRQSSAAVFEMVGGMVRLSDHTLKLTDVKVLAVNGNSVACLVHWRAAQPVGNVLNVDNIDVYTVQDGKITEAKVYSANPAQEDAFWGK